jgi:two-component system LytT family response regulator
VIVVDDESIARRRICRLLGEDPGITVIAECADGKEAVQVLLAHEADLLFLDVEMPEMDGMAVLQAVPAERIPPVVFVTAHDKYAVGAFEVEAVDYLLKPFTRERFGRALERARARGRGAVDTPPRLAIKTAKSTVFVRHDEIDWIEAAGNYACVRCGAATHIVRETLSGLEQRLPEPPFVRIHRSTIVNVNRVQQLQPVHNGDCRVLLANGTVLALSRTYAGKIDLLGKRLE